MKIKMLKKALGRFGTGVHEFPEGSIQDETEIGTSLVTTFLRDGQAEEYKAPKGPTKEEIKEKAEAQAKEEARLKAEEDEKEKEKGKGKGKDNKSTKPPENK